MKRLHITRSAFKDLAAIWMYIATDNIDAADHVRDELEAGMRRLCEMPRMGHERTDVKTPGYRFWRVYSYLIAYRVKGGTVYISRVIHGARDFRKVFKTRRRRRR